MRTKRTYLVPSTSRLLRATTQAMDKLCFLCRQKIPMILYKCVYNHNSA